MYTQEQVVKSIEMTAKLITASAGECYEECYKELVRDRTTFPNLLASFIKATVDTYRKIIT